MTVTISFATSASEVPPPALNLANANFHALWSALGLSPEACGEISPEELCGRLRNLRPRLASLVRAPESVCNGTAAFFDCGRSIEQVGRYYFSLLSIAAEARRRGIPIVWN